MAFKQPGSGESFPTCVTLVVEAVCEHVHAQGGHAHVHLATNSTLLGRARGEAQVGLLVSVGIELPNKFRYSRSLSSTLTSCCWWRSSSRTLRTCTWACTRCTDWPGSCCARRWRRRTRRCRRWSCLDRCRVDIEIKLRKYRKMLSCRHSA